MAQNSFKAAKYLSIPTIFISNLAVYIIIGIVVDKRFDIGNYLLLFIIVGIFMSCYSTYKMLMRITKDDV